MFSVRDTFNHNKNTPIIKVKLFFWLYKFSLKSKFEKNATTLYKNYKKKRYIEITVKKLPWKTLKCIYIVKNA